MKEALVNYAKSLGFDICRVAKCSIPPHAEQFKDWLAEGCAGEMSWLDRNKERRTDPQKVLIDARSVIVLGMNYWQGNKQTETVRDNSAHGEIARYAWGKDYHELITRQLQKLDHFLKNYGGIQKCYVDTGPVMERDFAAKSGIGWHGKSTMLINSKLGTWFFLAEILTTIDIIADQPEPDRCGRCVRCIDACPTHAITAPYKLDARRCISYLTIELKGSIPIELRPFIGDRIYGCDDCLSACPWNRFAKTSNEVSFAASHSTRGMTLVEYLNLTEEQFRILFRHSPIKRIKRRGFLRNVCVALGNVGSAADLPVLQKATMDIEPLIAEHAQWAIHRIKERFQLKW